MSELNPLEFNVLEYDGLDIVGEAKNDRATIQLASEQRSGTSDPFEIG